MNNLFKITHFIISAGCARAKHPFGIIADRRRNHTFRHAGGKSSITKSSSRFLVGRAGPRRKFLPQIKNVVNISVPLSADKGYYSDTTQNKIDPAVFFKLCLVGYLENLISDRKLLDIV